MRGHNICFSEEILKIIPKLSLLLLLIWSPGLEPLSGSQAKLTSTFHLYQGLVDLLGKRKFNFFTTIHTNIFIP